MLRKERFAGSRCRWSVLSRRPVSSEVEQGVNSMSTSANPIHETIEALVKEHPVVVFMKGTKHAPACGFSATVVGILEGLISEYKDVNVLTSPELRDGIKSYSNWPTIPQLYVQGTFVGGCDIVRDMHQSGELEKLLGVTPEEITPPAIELTPAAQKAFEQALTEVDDDVLRFEISSEFQYDLYFGPATKGDIVVNASGLNIHLDRPSAKRADGTRIDFLTGKHSGFKIENPNEPPKVKQISAQDLQQQWQETPELIVIDVRTISEREVAVLPNTRHLTPETETFLMSLDRETPLVFHCHHGVRSQSAAEHFLSHGFRNVSNVIGGIEAWSLYVDSKVPRY
jgi:monothiol glutaredoxin